MSGYFLTHVAPHRVKIAFSRKLRFSQSLNLVCNYANISPMFSHYGSFPQVQKLSVSNELVSFLIDIDDILPI